MGSGNVQPRKQSSSGIGKTHGAALFVAQVVAQTALAGGLVDVLLARDVQAGV